MKIRPKQTNNYIFLLQHLQTYFDCMYIKFKVQMNFNLHVRKFHKMMLSRQDAMPEICKAKLNQLKVNSSGQHWMCITLGLQGSHVTDLPKHAWQKRTHVTAHMVKQVKGQQRTRERHSKRVRQKDIGSLSFRSLRSLRTQTYTTS